MNTSKFIYTESKKKITNDGFWSKHIDFLKKIENIDVFSFIVVTINFISFNILSNQNSNNVLFRYKFELDEFSENSIEKFVNKIKNIILELKYDKNIGIFNSNNAQIQKPMFFDEFGLTFVDKNNCIGCNDQTTLKLSCKHFCCLYCWNNDTKISNNKCSVCSKKSKCPKRQFEYYMFDDVYELEHIELWLENNYQKLAKNFHKLHSNVMCCSNDEYSSDSNEYSSDSDESDSDEYSESNSDHDSEH